MADDRRVRNSKKRIKAAFVECLGQTSLDHVTVKQICDIADINRSTFYAHFEDPYQLYDIIESETIEDFREFLGSINRDALTYKKILEQIIQYVNKNDKLIFALVRNNTASFKESNYELFRQTSIWSVTADSALDEEYVIEFFFGGILSILTKWIEDGKRKTIDELVKIIYSLTTGWN